MSAKETTGILSKHIRLLDETKMFYMELLESGLPEETNNKILKQLYKIQQEQSCFEVILKH